MILVRTTILTADSLQFADCLASESGRDVAFILDGHKAGSLATERDSIVLTEAAMAAAGVFCPPDFAWRCGDYGLYLARQRWPDCTHFWLVEADVRLLGGSSAQLFDAFDGRPDIDFLACRHAPASPDWWWRPYARGLAVETFQCVFNVVRISAQALDHLLAKRRAHSKSPLRRRMWPNDEAFVATTCRQADFAAFDINDFGRAFYDDQTLTLTRPVRGETLAPASDGAVMIYHPVLFGDDFARGNRTTNDTRAARVARRTRKDRLRWALMRRLAALHPW